MKTNLEKNKGTKGSKFDALFSLAKAEIPIIIFEWNRQEFILVDLVHIFYILPDSRSSGFNNIIHLISP